MKADLAEPNLKTIHISKLTFVLCDFGLARLVHNSANVTMTLSTVGTWEYVPPEVREDIKREHPTGQYEASFDIFSTGVVTHELIKGRLYQGVLLF